MLLDDARGQARTKFQQGFVIPELQEHNSPTKIVVLRTRVEVVSALGFAEDNLFIEYQVWAALP